MCVTVFISDVLFQLKLVPDMVTKVPASKSTFAENEQLMALRKAGTFVWEERARL